MSRGGHHAGAPVRTALRCMPCASARWRGAACSSPTTQLVGADAPRRSPMRMPPRFGSWAVTATRLRSALAQDRTVPVFEKRALHCDQHKENYFCVKTAPPFCMLTTFLHAQVGGASRGHGLHQVLRGCAADCSKRLLAGCPVRAHMQSVTGSHSSARASAVKLYRLSLCSELHSTCVLLRSLSVYDSECGMPQLDVLGLYFKALGGAFRSALRPGSAFG